MPGTRSNLPNTGQPSAGYTETGSGQTLFLALREIYHQKGKFALVVAVIALVAYLAFFLSSLAGGLAHSYRAAVDDWDAQSVVLTDASNDNISASRLTDQQIAAVGTSDHSQPLIATGLVIEGDGGRKTDAYAFGIEAGSFLIPPVSEGAQVADPTSEVIAADALKQDGWAIGDTLRLSGSDYAWRIVGFAHDQTFQAAPVVFFRSDALRAHGPASLSLAVNAMVSQTQLDGTALADAGLSTLTESEFIDSLPGYRAQVLTFTLMIVSLIVIAAFVLGIFIYVLTLQKRPVLGILKARGVPTSYLIFSGGAQTTLLSAVGVLAGLGLTLVSDLFLPDQVPFRVDLLLYAAITAAFVGVAVLGGLISVRAVAGIDPVEAIA